MPGLPKRYYDFQFGVSGQEQKIDKKIIQGPRLSRVINGEILTPGVVQKRNGYQKLEDDGIEDYGLNWGTRLSKENSIVAVCDHAVKEYSPNAEDSGAWIGDKCSALPITTVDNIISGDTGIYSRPDVAYANNKIYVVVSRITGLSSYSYLHVFDAETKSLINISSTPLGLYSRIININDGIYIVGTASLSSVMSLYAVSDSTDDISSTTGIVGDRETTIDGTIFDIDTDGTYLYIAYNKTTDVKCGKWTTGGSYQGGVSYGSYGIGDQAIAVHVNRNDLDEILIAYCNSSNGLRAMSIYTSMSSYDNYAIDASVDDARAITIGTYNDQDDEFIVTVESAYSTESYNFRMINSYHVEAEPSASVVTNLQHAKHVSISHRICHYTDDGDYAHFNRYIGLVRNNMDYTGTVNYWGVYYSCQFTHIDTDNQTYIRIEPVAKYLYRMNSGIGEGELTAQNYISSCVDIGNNKFISCGQDIDGNICIFTMDMSRGAQNRLNSTRFMKDAIIASSIPVIFDSKAIKEIGFTIPPNIIGAAVTTGGSGLIAAGTYNFIVIFEMTDQRGRVYRSMPSRPLEVIASSAYSNIEIQFTQAICRPDWDENEDWYRAPTAVLYRTVDGGSIFYKDIELDYPYTEQGWFNNLDVTDHSEYLSLTSIQADSTLTDNETLYTTGGLLERCAPPPLSWVEAHDNRIFGIDSETGNIVYSAEKVEGEGPWFNASFVIDNPTDLGIPVALVSVPTGLMVFWKKQIGMIYGEGPNDLGIGGTYTTPRVLIDNIGCTEQRSLIKTPVGIMFKSASGFHIMGYDGSPPSYIGSGVYDFDGDEVVDASIIESKKQVRFTIAATSVSAGTLILVYSYEFNHWYVWGLTTDIDDFTQWETPYGGGVLNNAHHIVGYQGNTLVQGSTFQDGAVTGVEPSYGLNNYYMIVETGWLSLAGIQGFQRVLKCWLLGEYIDTHNLRIEIDYDYNEDNTQTVNILDATLSDLDTYQVRFGIVRQRCQAIKFKIMVITSSANKEGARLNALRLEYMIKKGSARLPIKSV